MFGSKFIIAGATALILASIATLAACGSSTSSTSTYTPSTVQPSLAVTKHGSGSLAPSASPTPTVPQTPQQQYINDLNSQYPDFASNLPDPSYNGTTDLLSGTDAAILDEGAQLCEALGSGGSNAAALVVQDGTTAGDGSDSETAGIIALTKSVLCPVPSSYQSKYQQYDNALKAAGLYSIVASADSNGDPAQFAETDICLGSVNWTQGINVTQSQADSITRITQKYLCSNASAATVPTVTYEATGSDISYGPAGSSNSGYSGMHVTSDIPGSPPSYYAITVLNGSCKLSILNDDGSTTVSQAASATGMANCELVSIGGQWYDANSGQ
jgi:hypothetical protein